MRSVQYGPHTISYTEQHRPHLKAHYLSVDPHEGVVLKGQRLPPAQADKLVLGRARWILDKLALVRPAAPEALVTGSRLAYLGRHYYTEVLVGEAPAPARVVFNHSRFRIHVGSGPGQQPAMAQALTDFFRAKAEEKLAPRLQQWAAKTGLPYAGCKLRAMEKQWGSCTAANVIVLNPNVIKLPYSLIDYVLVHELCHTKVKDHSKAFWAELSRHLPNWKELDAQLARRKE